MGHALHSYLSNHTQPTIYQDYVIFVAEVASTCNEALLMQHLLKQTTDKRQRAYLINYFLEQFRTTLYRHVLRNAVPATVTFLAMTVADIVAGSVVIEQVFAIPGLGRLLLSSISGRDYPVVQAVVVILAFWVVLVNLIADLINQRLDPRLRLS